jgi:hypothetical protein
MPTILFWWTFSFRKCLRYCDGVIGSSNDKHRKFILIRRSATIESVGQGRRKVWGKVWMEGGRQSRCANDERERERERERGWGRKKNRGRQKQH